MKKYSISIIIALILVLLISTTGSAALPGTGWWTAYRVQNLGTTDGILSMMAYDQNTTSIGSANFTVAMNESLEYHPGLAVTYPAGNVIGFTNPLPAGFTGSVVLAANVPIGSVAEVANYRVGGVGATTGTAAGMYQGIAADAIATELYVPTVKNNYVGQTTSMYVQAAGQDVSATITYTMNTTTPGQVQTYTQSADIPANRSFMFDPTAAGVPSTNCGNNTALSPCYGSAVITSTTGPMAGVLVEYPHTGSPAPILLATKLASQNDFSKTVYAPSIKNDYTTSATATGQSNAVVMNVGDSEALVRITLTVTELGKNAPPTSNVGDTYTATVTIPPKQNFNFSQWAPATLGNMPAGLMASAIIESITDPTHQVAQDLIGSGNDSKTQPLTAGGRAKIKYSLFSQDLATGKAAAPLVKEYYNGMSGGLNIQNAGTVADVINVELYDFNSDTTYKFWTKTPIPPGASVSTSAVSVNGATKFNNNNMFSWSELRGKEFSAIAYTSNGEKIIMIVAEYDTAGKRDISRYEGINY